LLLPLPLPLPLPPLPPPPLPPLLLPLLPPMWPWVVVLNALAPVLALGPVHAPEDVFCPRQWVCNVAEVPWC
jgi:hypothetical protein